MLQGLSVSGTHRQVRDWRRLLGTIRLGLTTPSAAGAAREQQALAGALRSRQIRPRRIAVIGSGGGCGTTTTAVLLASVLAAARDDQTLLLTMHSDASDVAARLAVPHAPSVTEVLAELRRNGRIPPTPVTRTRLRVLSAPPPGSTDLDSGLVALLDVAASGHGCVVVDGGVASRISNLAGFAECFDTVVLVCGTAADAVSATNSVLARWQAQLPDQQAPRLIRVPTRSRTRGAGNDPGQRSSTEPVVTHALPYDPELSRGATIDLTLISGPSMTAALTLAADIMGHR